MKSETLSRLICYIECINTSMKIDSTARVELTFCVFLSSTPVLAAILHARSYHALER